MPSSEVPVIKSVPGRLLRMPPSQFFLFSDFSFCFCSSVCSLALALVSGGLTRTGKLFVSLERSDMRKIGCSKMREPLLFVSVEPSMPGGVNK